MRTIRTFGVFFAALFLVLGVYAQDPEPELDYNVDHDTKTITVKSGKSINYSDVSSFGTDYTINLPEGTTLSYTPGNVNEWINHQITGSGTFKLAPTANYDNPAQTTFSHLDNFSGTLLLVHPSSGTLRLRGGGGYGSFSPNMTVEVSGNSQLWLNQDLKCKLYLHDQNDGSSGGYDGLGLLRFDGSGGNKITGPISVSGKVGIAARMDNKTVTKYISGAITGVHSAEDTVTDAVTFKGGPGSATTIATIVLSGSNYWNGPTTIDQVNVELTGNGSLGAGTLTLSAANKSIPGTLTLKRDYTLTQDIVNNGIINVNTGTLTISKNPTGSGKIEVAENAVLNVNLALNTSNKITGTGTVNMTYVPAADAVITLNGFSDFEGTLNLSCDNWRYRLDSSTVRFGSGRTIIGEDAQLFMNNATVYGNLEFGNSTAYKGDSNYKAALRADGTGKTSKVYGTVTLTDDQATICTRADNLVNNVVNPENGTTLVLYADVTGPGSLTKREDTARYAGVLTFATATQDGTTYGGTVDYAGTTDVKTGILRVADGVTMYGQNTITVDSGAVMDLQSGSTLAVGAKDATTGTTLNVTGAGELRFNGDMALDIYSETDFDQLVFNGLNIVSDPDAQKKISVSISNSADLGDTLVPVVLGMSPETLADWVVSVSSGYGYTLGDDGTLWIGSVNVVPEPSTVVLLVLGLGLIGRRLRRTN